MTPRRRRALADAAHGAAFEWPPRCAAARPIRGQGVRWLRQGGACSALYSACEGDAGCPQIAGLVRGCGADGTATGAAAGHPCALAGWQARSCVPRWIKRWAATTGRPRGAACAVARAGGRTAVGALRWGRPHHRGRPARSARHRQDGVAVLLSTRADGGARGGVPRRSTYPVKASPPTRGSWRN